MVIHHTDDLRLFEPEFELGQMFEGVKERRLDFDINDYPIYISNPDITDENEFQCFLQEREEAWLYGKAKQAAKRELHAVGVGQKPLKAEEYCDVCSKPKLVSWVQKHQDPKAKLRAKYRQDLRDGQDTIANNGKREFMETWFDNYGNSVHQRFSGPNEALSVEDIVWTKDQDEWNDTKSVLHVRGLDRENTAPKPANTMPKPANTMPKRANTMPKRTKKVTVTLAPVFESTE